MSQEEILEYLKLDLELRRYSSHTHAEYLTKVKSYQQYFGKPANELGEPEIKVFLQYLSAVKNLASGSIIANSLYVWTIMNLL